MRKVRKPIDNNVCFTGRMTHILPHVVFSFMLHVSLVSFILTLPLHSGSLDALSLGSLFVYLRNDDGKRASLNDRNTLETSVRDPKHEKIKGPKTAKDISARKTDKVVTDKILSKNREKTAALIIYNAEKEKDQRSPIPVLELIQEKHPVGAESSESRSAQIKGKPVPDSEETGRKKDSKAKVIADDKPVKSIPKSPVKESSDAIEPTKTALNTKIGNKETAENVPKKDIVPPGEKPSSNEPFQTQSVSIENPVQETSSSLPLPQEESGKAVFEPEVRSSEIYEVPSQIALEKDNNNPTEIKEKLETKHEPPVSNPPVNKSMQNGGLKKKAVSGEKGQGQSKNVKKSNIYRTKAKGNARANAEAKSQVHNKGYKTVAIASETSKENSGEVVSSPVSSQQQVSGTRISAQSAPSETNEKATLPEARRDLAQQGDDNIRKEKVDIRETRKPYLTEKVTKDEKIGLGVPKVEAPILKDIKIEVNLEGKEAQSVSMRLLKRPYPIANQRAQKNKQEDANCTIERKVEDSGASGVRHVFSVVKADKGIYTFVVDNKGAAGYNATIIFRIYEGQGNERIKEYKTVQIQPATVSKMKFLLPDAIFWDDEGRFSGEIENSTSTTKFHYESGLVWKEDKD